MPMRLKIPPRIHTQLKILFFSLSTFKSLSCELRHEEAERAKRRRKKKHIATKKLRLSEGSFNLGCSFEERCSVWVYREGGELERERFTIIVLHRGLEGEHAVRGSALFRMKSQRYEAFEASARERDKKK